MLNDGSVKDGPAITDNGLLVWSKEGSKLLHLRRFNDAIQVPERGKSKKECEIDRNRDAFAEVL